MFISDRGFSVQFSVFSVQSSRLMVGVWTPHFPSAFRIPHSAPYSRAKKTPQLDLDPCQFGFHSAEQFGSVFELRVATKAFEFIRAIECVAGTKITERSLQRVCGSLKSRTVLFGQRRVQ